jgi:hypothetical protein
MPAHVLFNGHAQWFTQQEHGGVPIERATVGSCDLSVLHVATNGNGWFSKPAATWRRVPRVLPMMRGAKQLPPPWRSSSIEMTLLTRTAVVANLQRLEI